MSGIGDVRVELAVVAEQIASAYRYTGVAHARIAEAVTVLSGLGEQPLVPAELRRAVDELDRSLGLISGAVAAVADLGARL